MKNKLMSLFNKLMLCKRPMIECLIHQLKNVFQAEHSRHRSPINSLVNILTALVAYMHYPNKPAIDLERQEFKLLQHSC
jgi:Transposase DDE domain